MEFIEIFFGTQYTYIEYLVFLLFTLIGMTFIKIRSYVAEKKSNPEISFSWKYWIEDNKLDFISAFIASFITLRFLGFMDSFISFNFNGMEIDIMLYGLILGITYQYTFRKLLKFATEG